MEFSRQEYWRGLPFPSPGDLPNPGMEPGSPVLQADSLPIESPEKPVMRKLRLKIVPGTGFSLYEHVYLCLHVLPPANEHLKPPDPEGASPALSPTASGGSLALPTP